MARYTLNLSEIIETFMDDYLHDITMNPYDYIDDLVERAVPVIFSDRIDIYLVNEQAPEQKIVLREEDRMELLKKILKHYWDYETCSSVPYDFIFRLNKKLSEIMPYYNQLYASAELEFNPFNDVDYVREGNDSAVDKTIDDGRDVATKTGDDTEHITTGGSDETVTDGTGKKTGTESTQKTGTEQETTNGGGTNNTSTGGVKWDFFNDTPQGKVNWGNPNTPNESNSNPGLDEMDYLSRYEKHVDSGSHNNTTLTNNSTRNNTKNGTDTTTFNVTNKDDETETTTYGKTTTDKIDYNNTVDLKKDNQRDYTHQGAKSERVHGKMSQVSYSERLLMFRNTILNIDDMIIKELKELFFKII